MSFGLPFNVAFPEEAFDDLISWSGQSVLYRKSHDCPCTYNEGPPDPNCTVCQGVGVYWDNPTGPYNVLITFMSMISRSVDIGEDFNNKYGPLMEGTPVLSIPYTTSPFLWNTASLYDLVIKQSDLIRYNVVLRLGQNPYIPPIFSNVTVAASGAVTVYDVPTNSPVSGVAYTVEASTVSGVAITLDDSNYNMTGQGFTVEFTAAPTYTLISEQSGVHTRPFGQGGTYPRRFRLSLADLWLRNRIASTSSVGPAPG